jgi:hypothetical protein
LTLNLTAILDCALTERQVIQSGSVSFTDPVLGWLLNLLAGDHGRFG